MNTIQRTGLVAAEIDRHNAQFVAANRGDVERKIEKIKASPFQFYRGTAHLFYHDMRTSTPDSTGALAAAWLCGDAHIANFGSVLDSGDKQVFAIGDFDEGYVGPFIWELRRLAASLVLAARDNKLPGADDPVVIAPAIHAMAAAYRDTILQPYAQLAEDNTSGVVRDTIVAGAENKPGKLLKKYTEAGRFNLQKKKDDLAPLQPARHQAVAAAVAAHVGASNRVLDVCQRVGAGVGSLGKLRYYALLETGVILELKQATQSAVTIAADGMLPPAIYQHHEGCRIARTEWAHMVNPDPLSSYTTIEGVAFYVHEKSPRQEDFEVKDLDSVPKLMEAAPYLGRAVATAHALAAATYRAALPIDMAPVVDAANTAGFLDELADFAFGYAAQTERDWAAWKAAPATPPAA
ncbi:DUF2252 family protein [Pseudoduganella namucuonensis]|uniref:Uncharacterized conserved protein, DUF2252 family n=1 Tax=Pseudoduganella namucuonensis TaxID=1035707 RepID=A0A1I7L5U6_9BURK|nr:DUF2252 family protein [Pseudoduganella namucuonensis]SFV04884.1 Uncharacterized conserved protein, DUF2252 family [Pseudoduganella namucuonensis]